MFLLYASHSWQALESLRGRPECVDTQQAAPHSRQDRADSSSEDRS